MINIFFEGFLLQASLIFALGAQNIFVLEAGLRRQHTLTVSFVCFLCDFALITLGVAGAASLFNQFPILKVAIGAIGVVFLFAYGLEKLLTKSELSLKDSKCRVLTLKASAMLAITFSILNPHAYLDAFILIGGYASRYNELNERLALGLGAAIYSGVWFLVLSSLSSMMKPLLEDARRMRFTMMSAGFALIFLSGRLAMDLTNWLPSGIGTSALYNVPVMKNSVGLFSSILY